ncbi:zinc finger C2H2 domain-containing protein [Vairimorpha necatrix]|uniref:Zinc finger C2H2 domain-containing protein n=1 Tax=Vairimorpha necatrix TaxID=6039 RepID=A0AAX4JFC2_9MICR
MTKKRDEPENPFCQQNLLRHLNQINQLAKKTKLQIKIRNNAENSIYKSKSFNDYKEDDEKLPIEYLVGCAKQEVEKSKTKQEVDHTKNESRKEKDVGILFEATHEYDNEQPLEINTESRRLEAKSECEGISLDQNEDILVIRILVYIPKENLKTKKALKLRNKKVKRVMDNPIKESKKYSNNMFHVKIIGDKKYISFPWKGWDDMPETCNKQWNKLTLVKRHYHSHTGIKGIECPSKGCNRTFTRKDFMKRHPKESCKYKDGKDGK